LGIPWYTLSMYFTTELANQSLDLFGGILFSDKSIRARLGGVVINPLTGINMLIKRIPMGMTIPHIILYPIVREIYHYKFHVSPLYPCLLVLACFSTCIRHIIIIHIYICICMYILPDCFF
jgi:hypothetical protein